MKSLTEIKATLAERKALLFNKYSIQSLAIFGSFARNEQNDDSDLDLVVEFNGKLVLTLFCLPMNWKVI